MDVALKCPPAVGSKERLHKIFSTRESKTAEEE